MGSAEHAALRPGLGSAAAEGSPSVRTHTHKPYKD